MLYFYIIKILEVTFSLLTQYVASLEKNSATSVSVGANIALLKILINSQEKYLWQK